MNDKLQQAITAIKTGDKVAGQQLLVQIVKADPHNEAAWLWMTTVTDDLEKKKGYLNKVLQINPNNEMAKKGLAKLAPSQPLEPVNVPEPDNIVTKPPVAQSVEKFPPKSTTEVVPAPSKPSRSGNQPVKPKLIKRIQPISEPKGVATSPQPAKIAPKAVTKNHTLIYVLSISAIGIILLCLGCFTFSLIVTSSPYYKATETARAIAQATPTPTSSSTFTPTPTPTPTFTPTPSYVLQLPQELKSSEGLVFSINRVDFLTSIDDSAQRYAPQNGIFLWLIGTVSNSTNEYDCIHGDEFTLRDNEKKYQMSRELAEAIYNVYDLNYPGFFFGQCLDKNETVDSFLIFDTPKEAKNLWVHLGDTTIRLGQLSTIMQATPIPFIPPTPMPTNTPLPTNTPKPIDTSIPPDTPVERWIPIGVL